jgi:hypothetical protein
VQAYIEQFLHQQELAKLAAQAAAQAETEKIQNYWAMV